MQTLTWSDICHGQNDESRCSYCQGQFTLETAVRGAADGCALCAIAMACVDLISPWCSREIILYMRITEDIHVVITLSVGYAKRLEILWFEQGLGDDGKSLLRRTHCVADSHVRLMWSDIDAGRRSASAHLANYDLLRVHIQRHRAMVDGLY